MKITDTHIYFWGGIYSNWHNCLIKDTATDLEFNNTEQAFMWYKANYFKDVDIKQSIERTSNPREAKALGRLIKNYDDSLWSIVRFDYMVHVNKLKFTQHTEYGLALLNTDHKVIVEASPYDKVWGVGLDENNPLILDSKNWRGQNLLGEALMAVRSYIRHPLTEL